MSNISKNGAPNSKTVGNVGDIWTDLNTGTKYKLVNIHTFESYSGIETTYDWDVINEDGNTVIDELADARVDKDGNTHDNVGEHIRNVTSQLSSEIAEMFTSTTQEAVDNWLNSHPEATTTVQDNSLTIDKMVVGTLGFVTLDMYGAKGDGKTDDTIAFNSAVESGKPIYIPKDKVYKLVSPSPINNTSLTILGHGKIINGNITVSNSVVIIKGVTFEDIYINALNLTDCDTLIEGCYFINIGISPNIDVTHQGCGVYNVIGKLVFRNNFTSNTHGHGAIFFTGDGEINVYNNRFIESYYRAIILYESSNTIGEIKNNYIKDNGKNLSGTSGVGCNGIYSTGTPKVSVVGNKILNVVENGIEGRFEIVKDNYIDGTGVDDSKATPSTEGIFTNSNSVVIGNVILNTKKAGISYGTDSIIKNIIIKDNVIRNSGDGNSILLNAYGDGKKVIRNCRIINNDNDGKINLIAPETYSDFSGSNGNVIKGNRGLIETQYIVNAYDYATNVTTTVFEDETLGSFSESNITKEFYTTDDGVKVLKATYNAYGRIYKGVPKVAYGSYYVISALVKGTFDINIFKNGSYFDTIMSVNSSDFVEFNSYLVSHRSTGSNIELRFNTPKDSVIEFKYIKEYVVSFDK